VSLEAFDAAAVEAPAVLPVDLQEAALAAPPVLIRGAAPLPVIILVELDVNAGS
jgi:hypothetical protein